MKMKEPDLDSLIELAYDSYSFEDFEPISDVCMVGDKPWRLTKLEREIELEGDTYHIVAVDKVFYADNHAMKINSAECIFFDAWRVSDADDYELLFGDDTPF